MTGRSLRVCQFMIGSFGGAERFFLRLCKALDGSGVEQHIIVNDDPELVDNLDSTGLPRTILRPSRFGGSIDRFRVQRLLNKYEPDIVVGWMNRAARRLPGGRHVNVGRLGGYYSVKNYGRCDHLIANTPGIERHCISEGWRKDRISMISNFTDVHVGRENEPRLRIVGERQSICALGRFDPWKGFDTLIRALAKIDGVDLLLAGKGPEESNLRALARSLGVEDRVKFLGWIDDRWLLFNSAHICVVPSRHEPLGNVILEAWSSGCPVVATASEGASWLIENNRTGLLVGVDDVDGLVKNIALALGDPTVRERLARNAKLRWEVEFSQQSVSSQYVQLFQELIDRKKSESFPLFWDAECL